MIWHVCVLIELIYVIYVVCSQDDTTTSECKYDFVVNCDEIGVVKMSANRLIHTSDRFIYLLIKQIVLLHIISISHKHHYYHVGRVAQIIHNHIDCSDKMVILVSLFCN